MFKRRLRLTLFESTRRVVSWLLGPWQLVGSAPIAAAIGVAVVMTSMHPVLPSASADEWARFIAPPKESAPAPSTERLSYIGLGGFAQESVGEFKVPEPDGTVPVAATMGTDAGLEQMAAPDVESERPLTEIEVDSAASLDPSAIGPDYPARMLEQNVEGLVIAQFVVDSLGRADTTTFRLLEPAEPEFVMAVKQALPRMKYRPAQLAGRPVSQLVQQPFGFRIRPPKGD